MIVNLIFVGILPFLAGAHWAVGETGLALVFLAVAVLNAIQVIRCAKR